ncbi:DUF3052 domain-containing protein [Streptomyces sp. NBC_00144]|uniref:DUF3052 domain-containing protein n=1 Tax=unclassified Streptomyces TaxID=2593676 RepID=UPI00324498F6|nr:DUF3052 domain-containing protein [Streptomyces sp. NBC_00932]
MTTELRDSPAGRMGFQPGQVVQEIGHGEDSDQELREAIEQVTGKALVGDDYDDVAGAVILWFRDYDGDLTDALLGAMASIDRDGSLVLLTPKTGCDGYVEPSDIAEAARTAGLSQAKSMHAGRGWIGSRLITPKGEEQR